MNNQIIPDGKGVRCVDCKNGELVSNDPPKYQENDDRLSHLFKCPKQPDWKRIHEDLIHRCEKISPKSDETKLFSLPTGMERIALEQRAVEPGNDRVSAAANAHCFSFLPRGEAEKKITNLKLNNALFGQMVESFYDESSSLGISKLRPQSK